MKPTMIEIVDASATIALRLERDMQGSSVVRVTKRDTSYVQYDAGALHSVMRMVLLGAARATIDGSSYYIHKTTVYSPTEVDVYEIQGPRGALHIGLDSVATCIAALEIMVPEILDDNQQPEQQSMPIPVPISAPFPVDFARAQAMHAEFESMDLSWKTAWNSRLGFRTNELEPNVYGLRAIVYDMGSVSTWGVFDDNNTTQPPRYGHAASFELATINCGLHIIGCVTGLALATEKQLAADAPKPGK